jgi:predicted enzyme related to lactoylglutathione lyase
VKPAAPTAKAPPPAEPPAPAPSYLHGKWVWFELRTTDVEQAKTFYGAVLGWQISSREIGGRPYTAISAGGKEIGLIDVLPADAKRGTKPAWMGYVSVPDVDAAVAAATAAGATTTMPARDMPDVGRFAVLADPAGTSFGVVKAVRGDEPDGVPALGQIAWMERWSKHPGSVADAVTFYAAVAGYAPRSVKMGKSDYTLAEASGRPRMGFGSAPKTSLGDRFVPYVVVANVDEIAKAATEAKGKVVVKPTDIPDVGRMAVLADPQGALIAVMYPTASIDASTNPTDQPAGAAPN